MKSPSKTLTLSAIAVSFILMEEMTYVEQNIIANWLMLVAQTLSTNSFFEAMKQTSNISTNNETTILNKLKRAVDKGIKSD